MLAVVMLAGSWTGLSAQDKVVKKIIETGTTDNKTMEHADWSVFTVWGVTEECDIYNKLIPEYMEHSAVVEAVVLYGLANLDHLLSREGLYSN